MDRARQAPDAHADAWHVARASLRRKRAVHAKQALLPYAFWIADQFSVVHLAHPRGTRGDGPFSPDLEWRSADPGINSEDEMEDDELHARFGGLRIAIAFAIKAASRTPLELSRHIADLRLIESQFPLGSHPGARDEFDGIIAALLRMPVRDPVQGHATQTAEVRTAAEAQHVPRDLLS